MNPPVTDTNKLRQEPDYPWADTLPALGHTMAVAPGVRWLRMPLPFALNHVNLWLLRDQIEGPDGSLQGWTAVDCGIADDTTRAAWEQVMATQLDDLPVLRVLVTHMHPDHVGLAHWLTQRWSHPASAIDPGFECRLWMSATDFAAARLGSRADTAMGGDAAAAFEGAIELARRCEQAAFDVSPLVKNSEGATVSAQQAQFVAANSLGFMGGFPTTRHYVACSVIAVTVALVCGLGRVHRRSPIVHCSSSPSPGAATSAKKRLGRSMTIMRSRSRPHVGWHR
jgi:hypothetical protein